MTITHTYEITDDTIQYVVDTLNEFEYKGRLTVEMVKNNRELFEYLFRKDVINDIENGEVLEAWNSDCFCDLENYL
jgi:hypothetical protein